MSYYISSLYKKTARIMIVVCGLLFSIFSFVYLYVFQRELLEALHFSLAHGKTQFAPATSAIVITLILLLLRWGVNSLLGLKGYVRALSYFPSFLVLCALTDIDRNVYTSAAHSDWLWLLPLLIMLFVGAAYILRKVFRMQLNREGSPMGVVNGNILIMLLFSLITVFCGNTDRTFHHELQAEHYLRHDDFDKALRVGEKSLKSSRTLTALRAMAMAHTNTMGDRLFDYPQYYGSEGLFFADDSLETLRYTNDSIYYLLGARPYAGEERMTFLRNICYKGTGKYTALDYYLSALLLDKKLDEFMEAANDFFAPEDTLPRFYREAMVLYQAIHADSAFCRTDSACMKRFLEYREKEKEYTDGRERENWMRRHYGDTYWWYFDYRK